MKTRQLLPFEAKCVQCLKVRDKELFETQWYELEFGTPTCDLCLRKRERISEGLFNPTNTRAGAVSVAQKRLKFDAKQVQVDLQNWRRKRRAELTAEGILYGDAAEVMAKEEVKMKELLGIVERPKVEKTPAQKLDQWANGIRMNLIGRGIHPTSEEYWEIFNEKETAKKLELGLA